jgi:hypothetical protein
MCTATQTDGGQRKSGVILKVQSCCKGATIWRNYITPLKANIATLKKKGKIKEPLAYV